MLGYLLIALDATGLCAQFQLGGDGAIGFAVDELFVVLWVRFANRKGVPPLPLAIGNSPSLANAPRGRARLRGFEFQLGGDGAIGFAVDELFDVWVAAIVDFADGAIPDDLAFIDHRDAGGDFTG